VPAASRGHQQRGVAQLGQQRRGTDWVLKTASGAIALTPGEAEAAQWVLARPDVTEAELNKAHPQADAPALLTKLRDAALLVAT
jgi:hypothetical protein